MSYFNFHNLKLNGKITTFSDDTALTYSAKSTFDLVKQIEDDLQMLKTWIDFNRLNLN